MNASLKGLTVVNTRPGHQAESLSLLIRQAGAKPLEFPVIEISLLPKSELLQGQLSTINDAEFVIFISANAVDAAVMLFGGAEFWPETGNIVSVGRATSSELKDYGLVANLTAPEPFNSEALLSMPELNNVTAKKILIFRGEGGRQYLGDTLQSRGANVDYVECYQRLIPDTDPTLLYQSWDEGRDPIIVVTSNEGLRNLMKLVASEYQQNLLTSTLVVVSQRAVDLAAELGFEKKPGLASTVSNEAIIDAIQHLKNKH